MSEVQTSQILVIEDETTQRILVKEYLEEKGYTVRLADDGRRGLEMASAITPDLIILDLLLPSMDGYTLCRRLKEDPATKDIPVILVTAAREADVIQRGMTAGASDFVTKPVDWNYLADRVSHVLQQCGNMKRLTEEKQSSERKLVALLEGKDLSPEQVEEILQVSTSAETGISPEEHEHALQTAQAQATAAVEAERQARFADAQRYQHELLQTQRAFWSVLAQSSEAVVPVLAAADQLASLGMITTDPEHVRNGADAPRNKVQELLANAQNMALLAQYSLGQAVVAEEKVELKALVTEAVTLVRPFAYEHQVGVQIELTEDQHEIAGDPGQLRYALHGLLMNAIKHCPPKGSVQVSLSDDAQDGLRVTIADNGLGMAPAMLDHLRSSGGRPMVSQDGRIGFGVPMSMAIMRAHDGTLELASEVGKGTTVAMHFPPTTNVASGDISEPEHADSEPEEVPEEENVPIARLNALLAS